jgi:hypothetical protein
MSVTLADYPEILRLRDYSQIMQQAEHTIRRELRDGRCRVAPCMVRPYRWRRADLIAFLSTVTITADRKHFHSSRRAS